MTVQTRRREQGTDERITPLELFFDLIFVFALTQVTGLVSDEPTWTGLAKESSCSRPSGGPGPRMPG